MAAEFKIKRHDREPSIRVNVKNVDGSAFNLTGYTSPRFIMRSPGATLPKVDQPAVLEDAAAGVVRYDWATDDTDTTGTFEAEVEITTPGGKKQTFPTDGYLCVRVVRDLNGA